MDGHWFLATIPNIDWANLSVGVAALVVLVLVVGGLILLVWKFTPQIVESWKDLAESISAMAKAVTDSTEVINAQTKSSGEQLGRIEHGVDRLHQRFDTWKGDSK